MVQLSDSDWYNQDYLRLLVPSYNGISVGQRVVDSYHSDRPIKTVTNIEDDGVFQLEDGDWYNKDYITPLNCTGQCN